MLDRVLTAAAVLTLAACSQQGGDMSVANTNVGVEMLEPAPSEAAASAPTEDQAQVPASPTRIAYAYRYTLSLPTDQAASLMARHEQACIAAGSTTCQVLGATSNQYGRDMLRARLEIRATPAWIARFRQGVGDEAEQAGGRVVSSATESEDLTRQLSDTEARMTALTTLRDRLQQLLATRSGPLEQLLQVERELARVQGELDATRSALEIMRTRVATSRLTIDYQSAGQLAPDSAWRPVSEALSNALATFMTTVGALILILSALLPIALLAAPLIWLGLKWRARRKARQATVPPPLDRADHPSRRTRRP